MASKRRSSSSAPKTQPSNAKRRSSSSAPQTQSSNATKKQISGMPQGAEAHAMTTAELRLVFRIAREKYAAQIVDSEVGVAGPAKKLETCLHAIRMGVHVVITEKRVLEVWPGQHSHPPVETFTHQRKPVRKPVDAAALKSDASSATLLHKCNVVRHIDELRMAFAELSTHQEATNVVNSIMTATKSIKSSLASLCNQATMHLSMLDLLAQSVNSQSHSAHELLLAWVQELRVMRHHMTQQDQRTDVDNRSAKVSLAIDNCLQSTSILSHSWQDQHLMHTDCHVLLKLLRTIQEHGLPPTELGIDFASKKSGNQDTVRQFLKAMQENSVLGEEDGADFAAKSSCNIDPEHDIAVECNSLLEALKTGHGHELLAGDIHAPVSAGGICAPVSMSSGRKDIEHNVVEAKMQSCLSEIGSSLQSSECMERNLSNVSASESLVDQSSIGTAVLRIATQNGHKSLTELDMASIAVQPPKCRPLNKHRPSRLGQASKKAPESSSATKTPPIDPSGTYYWTLDKEKLAPARLSEDVNNSHADNLPEASQCHSQQTTLVGRCFGRRGSTNPIQGWISPKGSLSPAMSREPSEGCFSRDGSKSPSMSYEPPRTRGRMMRVQGCLSPAGSMSPPMSREASRTREPRPLQELVRVSEQVIFGDNRGRAKLPAKLPALTGRRTSAAF